MLAENTAEAPHKQMSTAVVFIKAEKLAQSQCPLTEEGLISNGTHN